MRRVAGHPWVTPWVVLGIVEATLIAAGCAAIAYRLLSSTGSITSGSVVVTGFCLAGGMVVLMYSGGLYEKGAVLSLKHTLWRVSAIAAPIFALAVLATGELARYTNVPIYPYRWQWTITLTGLWLFSAVILRIIFREVHRSGLLTRRVMLLGTDRHAATLADLASLSHDSFRIAAKCAPDGSSEAISPDRLISVALCAGASEIVVAADKDDVPLWDALSHCRLSGLRVSEYLDFYEREGKRLCVEDMTPEWIALSKGFRVGGSAARLRRVTDVALAIVALVATAPVFLLTTLAIKLQDGGHVFYRQERVGHGGKSFTLLKFRSMRMDAERNGVPEWASERDSRITTAGKIIRKVRIDELPQFFNVLRGDMTIIGPRPERPFFVQQFSQTIPYYDFRHAVKPGITGWAQVSFRYGASLDDTKRKLSYDLYYVKNRSVLLDLLIVLKTVGVVMRGDGAR